MKIHYGEQHHEAEYGLVPNQEWLDLRHAMITGTGMAEILGTKAARDKYIAKIAFEKFRTPPIAEDQRQSADMKRGNELEPFAISAIEDKHGIIHEPMMFIELSETFGISPDFVNDELTAAYEIKCLQAQTTADVIINGIPKKHYAQLLGYFQIPSIETVTYTLFCPAAEMASQVDFIYMIALTRHEILIEIANAQMALIDADLKIKSLRQEWLNENIL